MCTHDICTCIRYTHHTCMYIYREKYSISRSDLAWLNRLATRTRWCALLNALVNAATCSVSRFCPRSAMNVHRVDAKSEFQVHLRVLKADVSRKINYLLVRATLRLAAFANELALPMPVTTQRVPVMSNVRKRGLWITGDHPIGDVSEIRERHRLSLALYITYNLLTYASTYRFPS